MRPSPDLDTMFGILHKPGGLQNDSMRLLHRSELDPPDGRTVRVHPDRILFPATDIDPRRTAVLRMELEPHFSSMRSAFQRHAGYRSFCYNWIVTRNGQVAIAPSHVRCRRTNRLVELGHPTLIGGVAAPMGRIGGELRYAHFGNGWRLFFINNNSGRYSADLDRSDLQLKNVADRFSALGFPVETQWHDAR